MQNFYGRDEEPLIQWSSCGLYEFHEKVLFDSEAHPGGEQSQLMVRRSFLLSYIYLRYGLAKGIKMGSSL